uniref:Uncharacterized protein n=1 Tax=Myotis myotis TaxID=51298 RepID=A0A7J7UCW1_MYOMY|nr:hypothetical protein mMyoMyo1_008811 [Myotis myotis]
MGAGARAASEGPGPRRRSCRQAVPPRAPAPAVSLRGAGRGGITLPAPGLRSSRSDSRTWKPRAGARSPGVGSWVQGGRGLVGAQRERPGPGEALRPGRALLPWCPPGARLLGARGTLGGEARQENPGRRAGADCNLGFWRSTCGLTTWLIRAPETEWPRPRAPPPPPHPRSGHRPGWRAPSPAWGAQEAAGPRFSLITMFLSLLLL